MSGGTGTNGTEAVAQGIRIQKVLADAGIASRRGADELVARGRVTVNGEPAQVGQRVDTERDRIRVDGRIVGKQLPHTYLVMHKPAGVTSTVSDPHAARTVVELVPAELREACGRLYPVGRLDRDSEGLLLLTNDGDWAQGVLHPRYGVEREYAVAVERSLTGDQARALEQGITLDEGVARIHGLRRASDAEVRRLAAFGDPRSARLAWYHAVLTQGWRRQLRRMFAEVGAPVHRLVRVRIGPLRLGQMAPGTVRTLTAAERRLLEAAGRGAQDRDVVAGGRTAAARGERPQSGGQRPGPGADGPGSRGEGSKPGRQRPQPGAEHPQARDEGSKPGRQRPHPGGKRLGPGRKDTGGPVAPEGSPSGKAPAPQPDLSGRRARRSPEDRPGPVVSIDGPGSSGKSSVGSGAARELGYRFFDTGLLYRALTLLALDPAGSVDPEDGPALARLISRLSVTWDAHGGGAIVRIDDMDAGARLHSPEIDGAVSLVARQPEVRAALLPVQRDLATGGRIIVVGRDIGSVVLPDADLKLYLDVSVRERARRRAADRGLPPDGPEARGLEADLVRRDTIDSTRAAAPLRVPVGAVLIRTDGNNLEDTIAIVVDLVRENEDGQAGAAEPTDDR